MQNSGGVNWAGGLIGGLGGGSYGKDGGFGGGGASPASVAEAAIPVEPVNIPSAKAMKKPLVEVEVPTIQEPIKTIRLERTKDTGKVIITLLQSTNYTFTSARATGREGPTQTQVDANYSGTNLEGAVTINTQGIQSGRFLLPGIILLKH